MAQFKGIGEWFAQAKAAQKKQKQPEPQRSARPALTPLAKRQQREHE